MRGDISLSSSPRPAAPPARSAADTQHRVSRCSGCARCRSPGTAASRLGLASPAIQRALLGHRAELVHLASPFFLGALGSRSARRLRLPVVAVYQTDVPGYARAYHWGRLARGRRVALAARHPQRRRPDPRPVHGQYRAAAPRTASQRIWMWGRGVDIQRFSPAARSDPLRQALAPDGEVLAGYVGRLAPEKQVELLAGVAALPGVRLVIVGGGPAEPRLRRLMPSAVFLGQHRGEQLARIFASLDVFVHSGCHETFGQTIQEAAASGLPVVAPAVGGPLDLVSDGVTGCLVTPGDRDALTAATQRLAADPPPGPRWAGRAAAGTGPQLDALGDQLIGHYTAVLGERSGAAGHQSPVGAPGAVGGSRGAGQVPGRGTPARTRAGARAA